MKKAATKVYIKTMLWFFVVAVGFVYMSHSVHVQTTHDAGEGKPLAVGSPAEIATHFNECWKSGEHQIPSFIIYRPIDGGEWRVGGNKTVNVAFEQLFNDGPEKVVVYAFCDKKE